MMKKAWWWTWTKCLLHQNSWGRSGCGVRHTFTLSQRNAKGKILLQVFFTYIPEINISTCIDFVQPILLLKVTSPSIWLSFKGKQFLTMETNNLILHALVWSDLCHIKSELACVMLELWRADQNVWHWEPSVNWRPPTLPLAALWDVNSHSQVCGQV